jgi:hypothetical protein
MIPGNLMAKNGYGCQEDSRIIVQQYIGELGVLDSNNVPGGRYNSVSWTDNSGNLWLFGRIGYTASGYYDGSGNAIHVSY